MSFFKKIDQLLAGFGNMSAMQRVHVDTHTEGLINNIPGERYGVSNYGELWVSYQELAGYFFINTSIVSGTSFKGNKGATLEFLNGENGFVVESDDYMIESDYSNVSNRWLTKINYCLEKEKWEAVEKKKFSQVKFKWKKIELVFDIAQ